MERGFELTRRVPRLAGVAVLVATIVGCSDDDTTAPPPVPTAPSTPESEPTDATTTSQPATSSPAESSTTELNPVPTTPAPPSTTTTAPVELPTVPTLVPQVPAELLTPEQRDPYHVNNSRPILPEHVPVIEAYLLASQAFSLIASRSPIDPNAPELLQAPFTPEILQATQTGLEDRLSRGEFLNVAQGATDRPYLIGPVTDTAVVYDCYIDGRYWVSATGEPVDPTAVFEAGPGKVVEGGLRVNMVQRDGQWLFDTSQIDDGACA